MLNCGQVGFVAAICSDEHISIPGCVDSCQLTNLLSVGFASEQGRGSGASDPAFALEGSSPRCPPRGAQRDKPLEELQSLLRIFTLKLVE
jgi:hypothetical protein